MKATRYGVHVGHRKAGQTAKVKAMLERIGLGVKKS
jgi:hypothetical protein